jgi:glycogen synthase
MSRIGFTRANRRSTQGHASRIDPAPAASAVGRRVIVAGFYSPPVGGEAIHVRQLVRFLRTRGTDVEVLNLNRHAAPSAEYRSARSRVGLLMMLLRRPQRSALLHLHAIGHNWRSWMIVTAVALAVRLKGIGAAITVHSGLFPEYVNHLGPMRRWGAGWVLRSFRRIICVNWGIANAVHGLGICGPQCRVVSPFLGVPAAPELTDADRVLTHRFRPLLIAVGGGDSDPELGLPTVAHACKQLLQDVPTLGVVFVGSRVGRIIRPLIKQLGLSEQAVCLGEVSHERCLSLIRAADMVVRSTFADGDSIVVREALGLGVPVVASDTDFRPEGVTLFQKGNAADLARRFKEAMGQPSRQLHPAIRDGERPHKLWQIYRELADAGGSEACAPQPYVPAG